jgi:hypothetical protein
VENALKIFLLLLWFSPTIESHCKVHCKLSKTHGWKTMAKDGYVDVAVVLNAKERPAPVAVIAHSGPSSSPPTSSRASSTEHILDHINIWINCCCCHSSSSSSSSIIFFFWDEELGWMDDRTDGWKGRLDRQTHKILYI